MLVFATAGIGLVALVQTYRLIAGVLTGEIERFGRTRGDLVTVAIDPAGFRWEVILQSVAIVVLWGLLAAGLLVLARARKGYAALGSRTRDE